MPRIVLDHEHDLFLVVVRSYMYTHKQRRIDPCLRAERELGRLRLGVPSDASVSWPMHRWLCHIMSCRRWVHRRTHGIPMVGCRYTVYSLAQTSSARAVLLQVLHFNGNKKEGRGMLDALQGRSCYYCAQPSGEA